MTILDNIKLSNIDQKILETLYSNLKDRLGQSLLTIPSKTQKTFGDICDIIESQINLTDKNDCTTQQAFYKVRKAIVLIQNFDEINIEPQTKLEDIFPRANRRQNVNHFQQALGFSVDILTMKTWLALTIAVGFILSLIAFFFSWRYAVAGLASFALFTWTVNKFSKELNVLIVRQLTEQISREHYSLARRHSGTMNRNEIEKTVQDAFIADHLLDREHLTKEANLGWT